MRQDWRAMWEVDRVIQEYRFTSLNNEGIARIHLPLELQQLKPPIILQAYEFKLEKIGEPYDIRVAPRSRSRFLL